MLEGAYLKAKSICFLASIYNPWSSYTFAISQKIAFSHYESLIDCAIDNAF